MTDDHPFLSMLRRIGVHTAGPSRVSVISTGRLSDEDEDDLIGLARRSFSTDEPNWAPPGKKLDVITTKSPEPEPVLPKSPKKARAAAAAVETLKDKRDRLRREIAELEGKRGKK